MESKSPTRHLYIIGNGFDRHHGADSTYFDFRKYLMKHDSDIVLTFEIYFGDENQFDDSSYDALWRDFEQNLSELNRQTVFDAVDTMLPKGSYDDDDFRNDEFLGQVDQVMDIVMQCTTKMQHHFYKWINTLQYGRDVKNKMLKLDRKATFLNFNYTPQLESEYHIPREQILYIHGDRRDVEGSLVFGHNIEDSEQALEQWKSRCRKQRRYQPYLKGRKGRSYANDKLVYLAYFLEGSSKGNYRSVVRYDAIELIRYQLEEYYDQNIKHSQSIITQHSAFFASLSEVEEITVLGHSLGNVDRAYFEEILKVVGDRAKWSFSYFSDDDIKRINEFCRDLNIPELSSEQLFKMEEIAVGQG